MKTVRYTLCFLTRGEQVLMLLRNNPPNRGLWNGVGGHIEPGESPYAGCLREISEETGFSVPQARFAGLLTWDGFEVDDGGLYIFTAPAPPGDPRPTPEGELAWKPKSDLFNSPRVVGNIHHFSPAVLNGAPPRQYHFTYRDGEILAFDVRPLPAWVDILRPF